MVKYITYSVLLTLIVTNILSGQLSVRLTPIKSDHIRVHHYGQHDKPFESFVITKVPLKLEVEEWQILVNEKVFSSSVSKVQNNKISFSARDENREFGLFKITVMIGGVGKDYYFKRRIDSVNFFKSWIKGIKSVKGSDDLIKVLDYILSRIDETRKVIPK
jgi:hypothetical protein